MNAAGGGSIALAVLCNGNTWLSGWLVDVNWKRRGDDAAVELQGWDSQMAVLGGLAEPAPAFQWVRRQQAHRMGRGRCWNPLAIPLALIDCCYRESNLPNDKLLTFLAMPTLSRGASPSQHEVLFTASRSP